MTAPDTPTTAQPVSLPRLHAMRDRGDKIAVLTAYDATFAAVASAAGVDCILVGDSLAMVCQGHTRTAAVTLDAMRYHVDSVARGLRRAGGATPWLIGDLPFASYHESKEQALRSAAVLVQAGAQMVKLEGGGWTADTVRFLVERGIPVCAHLGLTPQTVHAQGGYRVQGQTMKQAAILQSQAVELQDAGADMLVLEMVRSVLAERITEALPRCLTIGIGAGSGTAGQVLVMHDMLGIGLGKTPKFVRNFMQAPDAGTNANTNASIHTGTSRPCGIQQAMAAYVQAVKNGSFPDNALHGW